jgi:UDP-N-acetylmuramoyl-tripeptide--D-alanyl-D-alanine ligase
MVERGVRMVVGVRGNAESLVRAALNAGAAEAIFLPSAEDAGVWIRANLREGDAVLVKASRGVKLERALAGLD